MASEYHRREVVLLLQASVQLKCSPHLNFETLGTPVTAVSFSAKTEAVEAFSSS